MPDPLWNRVRQMKGRELHTLNRGAAFKIEIVDDHTAVIRVLSTGGPAEVRRIFLEPMWKDLHCDKELVLDEWVERTDLPSKKWATTYAAPILAELEEVEVKVETIRRKKRIILICTR